MSLPPFPQNLIDEDPTFAFRTFIQRGQFPLAIEKFLRNQQNDVYGSFLSHLGNQLLEGTIPRTSFFNEFLPQFSLQDYIRRWSPQDRGESTTGFNPRTTFNFPVNR